VRYYVHWHVPHRSHAHARAASKQFLLRSTTEQMPALVKAFIGMILSFNSPSALITPFVLTKPFQQ
jgi:hypothetical protein